MFTETIPFIEKIKENWITNYCPSWVYCLFKNLYGGYMILLSNFILRIEDYEKYEFMFDKI